MAAVQRKLVHKQFNSPMGLYSQDNVKATLNRELKAFGAEGIEIDDQIAKPLNLANSAVLRAVEEEEQQQIKCGYKRVAWPPASEERIVREFTPQPQGQSPAPGSGGYYPQSAVAAPAPAATQAAPAQPSQQQQPQYRATSYDNNQQQQQVASAPQWQQQQPQWTQQQPHQSSPYQQQQQQYQQQQQQQPPQPHYPHQNGGSTYAQPQYNSYSQPQQQQQQQQLPYSQDQTDLQQQQHAAFAAQNSYRGASPGIITLRKETPVTQQPAPVYTSQPAAVSYRGGSKLRGDLKWPPPEYKEAAARENEERRQLALGPVCRPRKVNRDYTSFFARNQLNNGYPSYKVPPGTQHMFA